MSDQILSFEILKEADASLWRQFQEEKSKWEKNKQRGIKYPNVPTCDDLFVLANRWKGFVNSGIKINQVGFSTTS